MPPEQEKNIPNSTPTNNLVPQPTPPAPAKPTESGFWSELVRFLFIALVIVVPFRLFVAQPFVVNGASMDPTFETGDYLIVDQVTYRLHEPERGDVVIFKYPKDPSKFFIKRIIGLPGEKISITEGQVTIRNNEHPGGFNIAEPYIKFSKDDFLETQLASSEYYVMGDNRAGSSDSRVWGPLPRDNIVGRPVIRLFPLNHLGLFPGLIEKIGGVEKVEKV